MARSLGTLPVFAEAKVTAYRAQASSYDSPFVNQRNSDIGRWNAPHHPYTQYFSLSVDACWAEMLRHRPLSNRHSLRYAIWMVELPLETAPLADLSRAETFSHYGITLKGLVNDDYSYCHDLRDALEDEGFGGVVAPSAALYGHLSLTLFGRYLPDRSASQITLLGEGFPPENVHKLTRYRGEPYKKKVIAR